MTRIKGRLRQVFAGMHETREKQRLEVLDTFDWRLFGSHCLLLRHPEGYRLVDLRRDEELAALACGGRRQPRFWWDLADSPLKDKLKPILDVRALMPRLKLTRTVSRLNLVDGDEKTVVRLIFERLDAGKRVRALKTCTLSAIRGYPDAYAQAEKCLVAAGFAPAKGHSLVAALRQTGLNPGGYTTKPSLPLKPDMPADQAAGLILTRLAGIMAGNVEGIRKDIDSEFLHDFRVAVRRSRCLLALMKPVLDPSAAADLRRGLKALGQATNALRDLDVYLLHQAGYQAMLPEPLRPAIGPLFKTLQKNRIREKAKINALLDAPAYHDLVARLRDGGGLQGPSGGAGLFTGDLSRRLIFKLFKKTIKMGRSMVAGATDQALHGLRIQCKKLRYAIEFFVSLMDADQAGLLIGQLKSLQDYLGRVNDLAVQQRFLFAYLQTIPARAADRLALSAAVGALIGGLYREQGQLRTGFADVFGRFDTKGNRRCYRRLFGPRQALP